MMNAYWLACSYREIVAIWPLQPGQSWWQAVRQPRQTHSQARGCPEGGLLRRSNFNRRIWRPATRAAGVEGLRFHDLRHTSATLSIAAGASTRELMARMGHSSSAAALRYQHVMAGRDATIAAALDELIEAASTLAETPPSASSGTRVARIGQPGSGKKRR
jgi:Phage integrase family